MNCVAPLLIALIATTHVTAAEKTNILFILTDDQGYGDVARHDARLLFHHAGRWPSGLAADHQYAMAAVQTANSLLVRSEPCGSPACEKYSSQCTTLRLVYGGDKGTPEPLGGKSKE